MEDQRMASGIKGFKSQKILKKKINGYTEEQSVDIERYVTVQEITGDRYALDVLIHGSYETGAAFAVEAGSNIRVIKVTGHGAQKGDFVKFVANGIDVPILSVPDANTVILGSELDFDPTGLSIHFLRSVTPSYNPDGSLNVVAITGPIQFKKDGTAVEVMTDSVTPANSVPLPVELRGASGPINITAGDINVQLSDKGANPDITRIGDGVNELQMNASGEAKVHDASSLTKLTSLDGKDFATSAKQDTGNASLGSIDGKLTTLNAKDFATSAKQDAGNLSLGSIDTKMDAQATAAKQDAGNASLSSIDTKLTSQATGAKQDTANASLGSIDTKMDAQATAANQATANGHLSNIATASGAPADGAPVSDNGSGSIIAFLKRVATNITTMSAKLPAALGATTSAASLSVTPASDAIFNTKPKALTNSYDEYLTLTTVQTFVAPANAIGGKIMAQDNNGATVRYKQNGTATTTSGIQLQAGRAEDFTGGSNITVVSESGTNAVMIQWTIQA